VHCVSTADPTRDASGRVALGWRLLKFLWWLAMVLTWRNFPTEPFHSAWSSAILVGYDSEASLSTTPEQEGVGEACFREEEKHLSVQKQVAKAPHSPAGVLRWNCFLDTVNARDSLDNDRCAQHKRPEGSRRAPACALVGREGNQRGNAASHWVAE